MTTNAELDPRLIGWLRARQDWPHVLLDQPAVRQMIAVLQRAGADAWQPIETAPRQGMILLGRAAEGEGDDRSDAICTPGYWQEGWEDSIDDMGCNDGFVDSQYQIFSPPRTFGAEKCRSAGHQPTHWMPLPAGPGALKGTPAAAPCPTCNDEGAVGTLDNTVFCQECTPSVAVAGERERAEAFAFASTNEPTDLLRHWWRKGYDAGWDKGYAATPSAQAQRVRDDTHAFKNFHRSLCERFDYTHDEIDWRRDQVSLIEHIAAQAQPSGNAGGLEAALTDLLSWFDGGPSGYGPWIIKAGENGADDAINAARAAIAASKGAKL